MNNASMAPMLSVIIPTHKRPQFLQRAINSALQAAPDGDVEVLVVPNGPDESWKSVAKQLKQDARVQWHPIDKANANVARNHGISLIRGRYVRFLDDDDYFLPGSADQVKHAYVENVEICSAPVDLVSANGSLLNTMYLPRHRDFVTGILSPERKTGLQFHLYKASAISAYRFHEGVLIGQDTHWTHALCQAKDWSWSTIDSSACTWVQHSSTQTSSKLDASGHLKLQEQMLWESIIKLDASMRLDLHRKSAAAQGMWHLIHSGFFLSPGHWLPILQKTRDKFPSTYPEIGLYQYKLGKLIPPELVELMMLPKRWINHRGREFLIKRGIRNLWQSEP